MRVRKKTESLRVTAGKSMVQVLGPENEPGLDADRAYRRVQLCTPASPQMQFSIDSPSPTDIGLDRGYHVPIFPPGKIIPFVLRPEQSIYGMAQEGVGHATLLVEYLEE